MASIRIIFFPGHITLYHPDLLKNSKWTWDYWPVLKTLEFHQPCSESMALRVMKSINTQKCPTLEKIIFKSRSYLLGTVYIMTVSSYHLLPALLNWFKPVYGPFGQRNMQTIDFCPHQPGRNKIC
jgi:hypothetical protein